MTGDEGFRQQPTSKTSVRTILRAKAPRRELNHPVPVDEFDRERMGIAAKE